jgi:Ca2+/Na+ antiporter
MKDTADSLKPNVEKSVWVTVIDFLIGLIVVSALMYTYIWNPVSSLKLIVGFILMACAAVFILKRYRFSVTPEAKAASAAISKLALLNEDGERIKEWYIQGETSLIIGKSSSEGEVEIDLTEWSMHRS